MSPSRVLQPAGWPRPKGYANGVTASGRLVVTAGLVGWDENGRFGPDLVTQVEKTLRNGVTVLAEGGARPEHVARMTWFVVDKRDYLRNAPAIGEVYREIMGRNFPAMSVVEVAGLLEDEARVEIEFTAIVPENER